MSTNYQRAKEVVRQINNGEWVGVYNNTAGSALKIQKNDVEIWVANTGFDCTVLIPSVDLFGYLWRHWVWFAAQKLRKQAKYNYMKTQSDIVNKTFNNITNP